jgi:hypothetical protein
MQRGFAAASTARPRTSAPLPGKKATGSKLMKTWNNFGATRPAQAEKIIAPEDEVRLTLGPVNNYPIVALPPKIFSGKARGEKFGYSK